MRFMKSVGLPITLRQLGITAVDEADLRKVAEAACVPTQSTRNLSVQVTVNDVYEAILEADRKGTDFLSSTS